MGSKLLYYGLIYPLSLCPFWFLYALSDFLYIVMYKWIGYRKKVVFNNLQNSFPDKEKKEIQRIAAKFYAHLCDLIVESIKAFSISREEALKRMKNRNIELINQFHEQQKPVIMVGGHYGNWELYAITIGIELQSTPIALYTPLTNKFINKKITESRSKYGLEMLSISKVKKKLKGDNIKQYAVIFVSDQSPRKTQKAYWMRFLNQETGVQHGAEKMAKEQNAAVVFGNIYKVKRGFYEVEYQLICRNANKTPYGFITQKHTQMLEKDIQKQAEFWLWSHKRWKHQRPADEPLHAPLESKAQNS